MSATLERRDGSETLTLTGIASATGIWYPVGFYEEQIARGAFKRSLNKPDLDVQLLVNHGALPLARTTSGTLTLSEIEQGLLIEAELDPTDPDVRALEPKMRRGDVTEMSFAFRSIEEEWNDDYTRRTITSLDLHRGDVSVVSYGANPTTNAQLRAEGPALSRSERERRAREIDRRVVGLGTITALGGSPVRRRMPPRAATRTASLPNLAARARVQYELLRRPASYASSARALQRRSGYAAHELAELGGKGEAFLNPDGHWSYPTRTRADWEAAKDAVGRSGASHNAVRKYLIGRAKALGISHLVPDSWAPSGALRK